MFDFIKKRSRLGTNMRREQVCKATHQHLKASKYRAYEVAFVEHQLWGLLTLTRNDYQSASW